MCCKRQGQHSIYNTVTPSPRLYIFLRNYVGGEEVKLNEQGDEQGCFRFARTMDSNSSSVLVSAWPQTVQPGTEEL